MDVCYCTLLRGYVEHVRAGLDLTATHGGDCLRQLINAFAPTMYPDISPSQVQERGSMTRGAHSREE
jgi:hypothetical protein